jgi:hypothetical protein
VLLDEKDFLKKGLSFLFFLSKERFGKGLSQKLEKRDKDKPSEGSECYIKVLNKS